MSLGADELMMPKLIEAERKRRKRHKLYEKIAIQLLVGLMVFPLRGWFLMLAVGVLHSQWRVVPTLGYPPALVLVCLLAGVFSMLPRSKS